MREEKHCRTAAGKEPGGAGAAAPSAGEAAAAGVKVLSGTVAALRLDAVLALGFGLSRSRAVTLVKGGLVEVNGRMVESPARRLEPGDRIALQDRGCVEITALTGQSRKGRQGLKLKKFNK